MSRVVLASYDRVPSPKGASAHILANANALATAHEVALVTLGSDPVAGHRHRPIHLDEPNWLRRGLAFEDRVAGVFAEYDFDVYHVRSPFEGLAVPPGRRLVYEVNALYSVEAGYHFPAATARDSIRRRLRARELCLFDRADCIITPSAVTARYVADLGAAADRIRVVPNSPTIDGRAIDARSTAPRVSPPGAPVRMCYVGTLAPWQGVAELIAVLPRLSRPVTLTIVGTGARARRRFIDKLVRKRGVEDQVRFVEPLAPAALGDLLAAHDIGVAPLVPCERNLVQGCNPIKLLDYAAAGLAILAPDMPVVREVVGEDYPLYRRWSRSDLVAHLERLIASAALRAQLAAAGAHRVAAGFSRDHHRARLLAVYAELGA